MDLTLIISIVVAMVVIYLFIRFIVSPIVRVILGIIIFFFLLYLLQQFGFNIDKILAPLGINLNLNRWVSNFSWIFSPINYYVNMVKNFLQVIVGNLPKK